MLVSVRREIERMEAPSQSMARIWARVWCRACSCPTLCELLCLASRILFRLLLIKKAEIVPPPAGTVVEQLLELPDRIGNLQHQCEYLANLSLKFFDAISFIQMLMEPGSAGTLFVDFWIQSIKFFETAPLASG